MYLGGRGSILEVLLGLHLLHLGLLLLLGLLFL